MEVFEAIVAVGSGVLGNVVMNNFSGEREMVVS